MRLTWRMGAFFAQEKGVGEILAGITATN